MFKKYKPYIISALIALAVGGLSAIASGGMDIYAEIVKPPLSPPPFLFPVVWSVLYILMGICSAEVYLKGKDGVTYTTTALSLYAINLVMNFLWSIFFFGLRWFLFSFIWLVVLIGVVAYMIAEFRKISNWAGLWQIPYMLWLVFAGYLNLAIYILN